MSRRQRKGLSPSLFPFLAVLVCTLGTLILFLALVAQNATDAAEQSAREERVAEAKLKAAKENPTAPRLSSASVKSLVSEEQFRAEQLIAFRDKQTMDLEVRRDQLTHVEDHMLRLREQLRQLNQEVERALGDADIDQIDDADIAQLRNKLDAERAAVEQLKSESDSQTPRVVIVPHKGPNGTDRRPVYLECTERGVTVWPEGSTISMAQLEDANFAANPLDSALRVVRLHALQNYGDAAPPYPLLIVRPNGIDTYAAARGAMQDWDDQFGYELVPAHVKLAYATPDPELKQRVDAAIREAAAKQHAQHAIARRNLGGRGYPGGGSGRPPGSSGRQSRLPTLSAADLDRQGRASGFRSHRDNSSPYSSSSPYFGGSGYSGGSAYTSGQTVGSGTVADGSYDENMAAATARKWDNEMRSAAGEMRELADTGSGSQAGGQAGGAASIQNNDFASPSPRGRDAMAGTALDALAEAARSDLGSQSQSQSSDGGSQTPAGQPGGTGDSANRAQSGENGQAQAPGGQSLGSQAVGQAGAPGGSQMSPSAGSQRTTAGNAERQQGSTAASPPSNSNPSQSSDLVQRRGRDWALPAEMAGMGGNAVVRTIGVRCYSDRFELPLRNGTTQRFEFTDGDAHQATLQLATELRDRIQRWGPALPGGRWQPRLDVVVMPDGEWKFHQLRTLMSGSGIEVTGRASQ